MAYKEKATFGTTSFYITNSSAVKKPGTLKQVNGKRLVQRSIPHRDLWDWNIMLSCVFFGTQDECDAFKETMYDYWGESTAYEDGVTQHAGNYVINNNGLKFDEAPDKYDEGYITFTLNIIGYNQTPPS